MRRGQARPEERIDEEEKVQARGAPAGHVLERRLEQMVLRAPADGVVRSSPQRWARLFARVNRS